MIADLKERLHDLPGIESLTMTMIGGKQQYGIAGKLIQVDGSASDAQVIQAIRAAVSSDAIAQMPAGVPVSLPDAAASSQPLAGEAVSPAASPAPNSPSAALIPTVNVATATVQPKANPVTAPSSPAAHALTIKDVLSEHSQKLDQILQAQIAQLQATLGDQVNTVQTGTDAVIANAKQRTEDFKAILGQFSNLPDGL